MRARYLAPARVELSETARYYGETLTRLALNFLQEQEVERAVSRVTEFPDSGAILEGPLRREILRKFPTASCTSSRPTRS
jgi:hypothetical protein